MEQTQIPITMSLTPNDFTNTSLDQIFFRDLEMELFYGIDEHGSHGSPETSIGISTSNSCLSTMFFDELFHLENIDCDVIQMSSDMEGIGSPEQDNIFYGLINEYNPSSLTTMEGDQQSLSFSIDSSKNSSVEYPLQENTSLLFPGQDMGADDQLTLTHLLRAYGEAKGNKEKDLTDILIKSIKEKSDPMGSTFQRIAYHLFRYRDEYLRQELSNNFLQALKVLYECLIDSRLAHFMANSAILESLPHEATTLHVVDFDLREGIQWPPLIEAFSCSNKKKLSLKITSIAQEDEQGCASSCYAFEETKQRLLAHARQLGVKLQIEEISLEDFASELTRMKKRGGRAKLRREWLVFNCMVGLPHMGHRRSRSRAMEFLRVAKESLAYFPGILALGDGETWDSYNDYSYASYFGNLLRHYQALFESLAKSLPACLIEARTTIEILFLAPLMSLDAWYQDWGDVPKSLEFEIDAMFKGRTLSQENIAEAKQMVNGRDHTYEVKIERQRDHEMVLQWNGVPLLKVSTWM